MNWHFAIEVAAWAGGLTFLAIWMVTAPVAPNRADERPRSDSEQQ